MLFAPFSLLLPLPFGLPGICFSRGSLRHASKLSLAIMPD